MGKEIVSMRSFNFGRLLKGDVHPGFIYSTNNLEQSEYQGRSTGTQSVGTHWQVTIKNYTREDIFLVNSLRTEPTRVVSIYHNDKYRLQETTNFVIIELKMQENQTGKNGEIKTIHSKKIEIRCPSHYLQTHSLFVEELGTYVTIESRLQATRECVAQDYRVPTAREVAVPESAVKVNPVSTFSDYEPIVKLSMERSDKIRVKVGVRVDVDPSRVPDYIKSMRIAVLDRDFSPYYNNRMIYDPTIDPDDFSIENHHWMTSEPIWGKFSDLHKQHNKSFFIDTEEHRTLGGVLCGMAIFGDEQALSDYMFSHRCEETYADLTKRIIDRNGNHALTKRIEEIESLLSGRDETIVELRDQIKFEKDQVKTFKHMAASHEDTIKKLKTNYESANGYDAIIMDLENQRTALELAELKLEQDRADLDYKTEQLKTTHRASMWKSTADMLKSGWGIILAVITISTAVLNMYNKLNSKQV
jgi:hypothetical protein